MDDVTSNRSGDPAQVPTAPGGDGGHTGANVCPACAGTGRVDGGACAVCGGGGLVEEPVGDA